MYTQVMLGTSGKLNYDIVLLGLYTQLLFILCV